MSDPDLTLLDGVAWRGATVPSGRGPDLLAALTLAAPRSVPVAELVEQVWADAEPAHPEKALQVLVSRVRSQTDAEALSRVGTGYRLGLRDDQVDLLRLRRLVEDAHAARAAGDLDVARLQARRALEQPVTTAAGRGPLADVVASAMGEQASVRRLLGSVLLSRGDAVEALPLLESALEASPDDETRLAEVLRAEAQVRGVAAALTHYASYAGHVRDELGAAPGEELQRLHAELLARDAPVRQGLKYDATPLLGRDDDVVGIRGLLERSRVVSIVGAGGLGKTRMAHLVGRIAEQPIVYFVELAGVTAADDVLPEVAGALGVRESMVERRTVQLRADLRSRVAEKLTGPPTLLILDNCEHLVDAVADLVTFLIASTDATAVLTTSRASLGIAAEQVYPLPQLDIASAVALFEQRARSARPGARLDAAEVAALVERLDGLPLAIELAAAKVRVMSVAEISRRLRDRFALLSGHDRSTPDRHQTLEAVIAWSWNLLGAAEQEALRILAAFPDGFSLEGSDALLGQDSLPALSELVDQSLLVVREDMQGLRYRFLETVREYGLKQLDGAGDTATIRARLRIWAVDSARAWVARLFSVDQIEAIGQLRAEGGNLAGVMRAALEDDDVANVVPLVGALMALWNIEGDHFGSLELAREITGVVVRAPAPPPEHTAELRGVLTVLVVMSLFGGSDLASVAVQRLRDLGVAHDGSRSDAFARVLLETYDEGQLSLENLDRLCADPDPATARAALLWATHSHENVGELATARARSRRALELVTDSDGPWMRAMLESQASELAAQSGDGQDAVEHALRALPIMEALGATEDVWQLRNGIAYADIAAGRLDEAQQVFDATRTAELPGGPGGWRLSSLPGEAELALARGEVATGLRCFLDALAFVEQRRLPVKAMDSMASPWVLSAESVALFAHVRHSCREEVEWLAHRLAEKLPGLLAAEGFDHDLPVVGGVMLAYGCWLIGEPLDEEMTDAAVRLVALGERFGYHRTLPTMTWANVREVVDGLAPDRLTSRVEEYAEQRAADLLDHTRDVIAIAVSRP